MKKDIKESFENFKKLTENTPEPQKVKKGSHYHAIELDPESKEHLLKTVKPKFGKVHASHITLNFKPSDEDEKHFDSLENKPVAFDVTHHAHHEAPEGVGIQAVRVAGLGDWHKKKPNTHVTISTAPNSKPAHSNDLLAANEGNKLDPAIKLTGHYRRLKK